MPDQYYDNVTLLLPFNDTAGTSSCNDVSKFGRATKAAESWATGTADLATDGVNGHFYPRAYHFEQPDSDHMTVPGAGTTFNLVTPGTNTDFTVEFWLLMDPGGAWGMFDGNPQAFWVLFTDAGFTNIYIADQGLYVSGPDSSFYLDMGTLPGFSATVWHHIAFSRSAGMGYAFFDGELIDVAEADTDAVGVGELHIGHSDGSSGFYGYMSDFRITDGVGRYTANFTPPNPFLMQISGTVRDGKGDPAQRTVIAVPRSYPCHRAWSTQSDPVDGSYVIRVPDTEVSRLVLADEPTLTNDIVDRIEPGPFVVV